MRDIPHPLTEMFIHIAYKNFEFGSIVGGFVVAPLVHLYRKRRAKPNDISKVKLIQRVGNIGRRGALLGVLFTGPMMYMFGQKKNIDEEGWRERCYRLRYNKKQLLIDRAVTISVLMGWITMRWPGVVIGTNATVIVGAFFNEFFFDKLRKHNVIGGDQMEKPDPNYKGKKL